MPCSTNFLRLQPFQILNLPPKSACYQVVFLWAWPRRLGGDTGPMYQAVYGISNMWAPTFISSWTIWGKVRMIRVSGDLLGVLKLFVYGSDGDDTSVGKTLLLLIPACTTIWVAKSCSCWLTGSSRHVSKLSARTTFLRSQVQIRVKFDKFSHHWSMVFELMTLSESAYRIVIRLNSSCILIAPPFVFEYFAH